MIPRDRQAVHRRRTLYHGASRAVRSSSRVGGSAAGNGNEKLKRRFQLFPPNNPAACFLRRLHLRVFIRLPVPRAASIVPPYLSALARAPLRLPLPQPCPRLPLSFARRVGDPSVRTAEREPRRDRASSRARRAAKFPELLGETCPRTIIRRLSRKSRRA